MEFNIIKLIISVPKPINKWINRQTLFFLKRYLVINISVLNDVIVPNIYAIKALEFVPKLDLSSVNIVKSTVKARPDPIR